MKKILLFTLLGSFLLFFGCNPNQKKPTKFKYYEISNHYRIKLPDDFNKKSTGFWQTQKDGMKIKNIEIQIKHNNIYNLESAVKVLANRDKRDVNSNKEFIKNEPFNNNGMKGMISYYKKDHSTGTIPVLTYYVFAVIQDNGNVIEFSSLSMPVDFQDNMRKSIYSLEKN